MRLCLFQFLSDSNNSKGILFERLVQPTCSCFDITQRYSSTAAKIGLTIINVFEIPEYTDGGNGIRNIRLNITINTVKRILVREEIEVLNAIMRFPAMNRSISMIPTVCAVLNAVMSS